MPDLQHYLESTGRGPEGLVEAVEDRDLRTRLTRLESSRAGHVFRSLMFLGPLLILLRPLDSPGIWGFLAVPAFISVVEALRAVRAHRELRHARGLMAQREDGA